jgi:hypothetical protein
MTYLHIESRHKEFFGLVCYHEYFTDKLCNVLEIEPTEETKELLRNYYLIFKPLPFGFLVTYSPEDSPQRLKHCPPETRFSFVIKSRDSRFVNYTKIPFQRVWEGFHFSNMEAAEVDFEMDIPRQVYYYFKQLNVANSRKKLLHLPDFTEVIFRPRRFTFDILGDGVGDSAVSYENLLMKDEWDKDTLGSGKPLKKDIFDVRKIEIGRYLHQEEKKLRREGIEGEELEKRLFEINKDVSGTMARKEVTSHQVDFRHAPYGLYKVGVKGGESKNIYLSEAPEQKIFGVIDIHIDPNDTEKLVNRDGKDDAEVINSKLYHLHFAARETHWRYFFMNHKQSRVKPTQIREENELLRFSQPEATKLENLGTPALLAVSENPIALAERPKFNLLLERKVGKRPMKDIKLPVPSIDIVRPMRAENNQIKVYSDVYVYL